MTTQFFDLMIDVESMGLPPDGALVSIGAVFFDLQTQTMGPTFNSTIHLGSAVKHGGVIDPGTVLFWLRQPDEARRAIAYGGQPIDSVLTAFRDWIKETCRLEDVRPFGNGAAFDLTLIHSAYKRLGMDTPWWFSNERCFRTIRNQFPQVEYDPGEKGDGAHNALADAIFQVEHLFKIKNRRVRNG